MSLDITTLSIEVKSVGIKDASNALSGLSTSANNVEKRVSAIVIAMEKLDAVTKLAAVSAGGYNTQLMMQMNTMSALRADTSATVTATNHLAASMAALSASLGTIVIKNTEASASQRVYNSSMKEAHDLSRGLAGSLGALWVTYGNIAAMGTGLAIGSALKGIVTVGKDVEHTLASIAVLAGATETEVGMMRDTIISLGQGAQSPKDVAEALSVLSMAGLNATDSLKGVSAALNLSTAGGVSVEKASSTLVQVGTALGYTSDSFSHIGDVIAKTAAVSMSSVESISGAFKSAAAVNELYGASLTDIGVGLAALSNLGIQGTAAGTSLKNFYADIVKNTAKVGEAFPTMKAAIEGLRDSSGVFLPINEGIGKLAKAMSTLDEMSQKDVLGKLLGERGVKMGAELVAMFNTLSTEADQFGNTYANKLEGTFDRVNNAYGFSTLAAIAMSQTTENQLKGVGNTLQTSFLKAFQDVSPQINEVARLLKEAFRSTEFISAISAIAVGVANLTKLIVEHINVVVALVQGYAALKVLAVTATLISMATGMTAVATATEKASIAMRLFGASLPVVGIAIAALTAAWALYNLTSKKALGVDTEAGKDAVAKAKEQIEMSRKKYDEDQRFIDLKKKGYSELQALDMLSTESQVENNKKVIDTINDRSVTDKRTLATLKLTSDEKARLDSTPDGGKVFGSKNLQYALELREKINKTDRESFTITEGLTTVQDKLIKGAKERQNLLDAERKIAKFRASGTEGKAVDVVTDKVVEQQEKAGKSMLEGIQERIAVENAQIETTHKLTDYEKFSIKLRKELTSNTTEYTEAAKKQGLIELDILDVLVPKVAAQLASIKATREADEAYKKTSTNLEDEIRKQENLVSTYGMTKSAIEAMAIARDRAATPKGVLSEEGSREAENILALRERANKDQAEYERRSGKGAGKTMEEAGTDALRKYQEEAMNTGKAIEDSLTSAFKNAEDALVNFVKTGKLDFSTLADSIISDIIRMNVKSMLGGGGSTGGFSNGAGLLSSLSGMFGGTSVASSGAIIPAPFVTNVAGAFADGGDPPVGKPSLVGERGPEIFVPKAAGTIVPNEMIGSGGGTQVTYSPVIHIDSRTDRAEVAQLVQKAVQSGNAQLMDKMQRSGINR
jgi:TP901 family phage tail tape measure protein/lambda family phage tail tape measure protein